MIPISKTVVTTFAVTLGSFYLALGPLTSVLAAIALSYCVALQQKLALTKKPEAPGPQPWPLLGSLHLMDGFRIPYAAFTKLASEYGNVFSMKLGSSWCVVVNDPKSVKEVLITKGAHFDARPTLKRLDYLFGGDKENSLAFCNNSDLQRKRRQILQKFTFPHAHSSLGTLLDQLCKDECQHLVASIHQMQNGRQDTKIDMKPLIRKACANIFSRYFCSVPRCDYDDKDFSDYTHNMDQVFWEINNGRAVDFLPWLMPYFQHSSAMATMKESSQKVRSYVKGNIIATKRKARASNEGSEKKDADFLDSIMDYIDGKANGDPEALLTSQSALFALEDILGGHAAVANIILRILHDLSLSDHVEAKTEVSKQLQNRPGSWDFVSSDERQHLPWVVAAMHETIRMTCSPIVPHQAAQDSTIGGYLVPKDTVIFVNNHALNMNEELWSTHSPEAYQPQRFLHPTTGEFSKPAHFQPFSMGKRSCVGYKMVHNVAFSLVSNLMMHFDIHSPAWAPENVPLGMLALPPEPFTFTLSPAVSCATKTPLDSAPIPPLCIRTSA